MHCIFIIHDCWSLLTFIVTLEKRPDNSLVAGKVNVITRTACFRCVLTLSINFLNTLMGLMKGHVINEARAFVLPCKGMHNETCTGTEVQTIKWLLVDDSGEPATRAGAQEMVVLCAQASGVVRWKPIWRVNQWVPRTWQPCLGYFGGWLFWSGSRSVGECLFMHSETTLQWEYRTSGSDWEVCL